MTAVAQDEHRDREKKNIAKFSRMSTANMQNEGKSTGLRINISASASDANITSQSAT